MRILLLLSLLYSTTTYAFFDTLGLSLIGKAVTNVMAKDQRDYRDDEYESPVVKHEVFTQVSEHCDPFGGCREYVSTTVMRQVKEYRYDYRPEWDEWAVTTYE
jgi:hypothetical protein